MKRIVLVFVLPVLGLVLLAPFVLAGLRSARVSGNEASAIGSVRAILSAQAVFSSSCGRGSYASSLTGLAMPAPGSMPALSCDLATDPAVKSGYIVRLHPGEAPADPSPACNGQPRVQTFVVSAEPVAPGESGRRYFAANQEGTVFESGAPIPVTQTGAPRGATQIR